MLLPAHFLDTRDPTLARAAIIAAATPTDLYIDFGNWADGNPPAELDTGQVTNWLRSNGNQQLMSGGKLIADPATAAGTTYAAYFQTMSAHDILAAGIRFTVNASDGSTVDGVAPLIIWEHVWDNVGSPPKTPCHVTLSMIPNGSGYCTAAWQVGDGVHAYHVVKTANFLAPAQDGVTEWEAAVSIDTAGGIATLKLPGKNPVTNDNYMTLSDQDLTDYFTANPPTGGETALTLAQYAAGTRCLVVEHIGTPNPATTRYPSFTKAWAGYKNVPRDDMFDLRARARLANQVLVDQQLTDPWINRIMDTNGVKELVFGAVASAVNYLQLNNAVDGVDPAIYALGSSTNVGLNFVPQGSGLIRINGIPVSRRTLQNNITTSVTLGSNGDYAALIKAGGDVTLPTAVGNLGIYKVKNGDTVAHTIGTTSAQTIGGSASFSLDPDVSVELISDGTNWAIW